MFDDTTEPTDEELDMLTVLAVLADLPRLATIRTLSRTGESWCTKLQENVGPECAKSTMSHYPRVLREAGVTRTRVAGARRYVSLRPDSLDLRFPGVPDAVTPNPRDDDPYPVTPVVFQDGVNLTQ